MSWTTCVFGDNLRAFSELLASMQILRPARDSATAAHLHKQLWTTLTWSDK
jgi:hypothetical protein